MAPEGMTMENPGYKNWGEKWGALMVWLLNQHYMREKLKLGTGGETGPVNDMVRHSFERTRAHFAHRGTSRLNCKRMSPDPAGFRSLGAIRRLRATKDKIANRVLTITAPGTLDNDRSGIW